MAILKEIEVTVQSGGQALEEYRDEDNDEENQMLYEERQADRANGNLTENPSHSRVSKYIESVTGAEFTIKAVVPASFQMRSNALRFRVLMDGKPVAKKTCVQAKKKSPKSRWEHDFMGSLTITRDVTTIRPFLFNKVAFVEKLPNGIIDTDQIALAAKCGSILVKIFDCKVTGGLSKAKESKVVPLDVVSCLPENKTKNLSLTHQITLGEERKTTPRVNHITKPLDGADKPIATFSFKYCSKDRPKSMLLIETTPPSVPLEERPIETLTHAELVELARRQQDSFKRGTDTKDVKSEPKFKHEGLDLSIEPGIKRERDDETELILQGAVSKRAKARPFVKGELIDLE